MIVNRYIVSDEDGELRRFATRVDAETFMQGQAQMSLKVVPRRRMPKPADPLTLVGECLF